LNPAQHIWSLTQEVKKQATFVLFVRKRGKKKRRKKREVEEPLRAQDGKVNTESTPSRPLFHNKYCFQQYSVIRLLI